MHVINRSISNVARVVLTNPGTSTATVLFGLAFALVSSNAMFSQSEEHPSPIWKTQDKISTQSTSTSSGPEKQVASKVITHRVLTQSISLKNIPVPTANPTKLRTVAAQSSLVREVQASLADVGIYKGKVDGIYGDETKKAIQMFQEQAGVIPDGEASYSLLAGIKSAFAVAQIQDKNRTASAELPTMIVLDHSTVSRVQTGLKEIYGDQEISVDGIFGNQTREALKRFQKRFKLPTTGELDQNTLDKLRDAGVVNSI